MLTLTVVLSVFLFFSIILNAGTIWFSWWYLRSSSRRLMWVSDHLGHADDVIKNFVAHVGGLYEMEMFYGDPIMRALMDHGKEVIENLENFGDIISISEREGWASPNHDTQTDEDEETEGIFEEE